MAKPNGTKLLEKKVALVTGAASGIGREVALKLAEAGATVVVSDINEDAGQGVVRELQERGATASFFKADTSKPADNEALVAHTVKAHGGLHIAVNNAGIGGPLGEVGEYPIDGWDKVIAINLSGVFYGMRYQIPAMLESGGGSIVNMASILGFVGTPNSGAYVAAKHGVVGLTKSAAIEYAQKGIRVNSVGPGYIRTPLVVKSLPPEAFKMLEEKHAMGRLGEASEVANLVRWLASDEASFVTGSYYTVDGGYTAM